MKIKILFTLCILLNVIGVHLNVKAQSQNFVPTVFQKSPNSQAFAKYGDYPVNLFSGLPDISIPLYTIEAGGLQVPVTLSYHASGLKVNEPASWVGAGWSLNTGGGGITRNILGRSDDNGGYLTTFRSTLDPYVVPSDVGYLYDVYNNPDNNQYDSRPDIYSYDLPGHSGKFFFNGKDSNRVETIPYAPLAIKRSMSAGSMCFNIIDEHGTKYNLGYNTREVTSAPSISGGATASNITAWKLENMIGQNGRDTINFAYTSQGVVTSDRGQSVTVEDQQFLNYNISLDPPPDSYATTSAVISNSDTDADMNEEDISTITFKNGKVTFTLDAAARTDINAKGLKNMQIYTYNYARKAYELQKTIVFYKSYYTTATGISGRLRLDSLQVLDKAGSVTQRYNFVYNQQPVADYHSFSKDYWGYYNGKMNGASNPTLIPKQVIDFQPHYTDPPGGTLTIGSNDPNSRNPDSTYMQAGVLKAIYYPTGGHTTFGYQTNRYYDTVGAMHLTGGLRIDSIASYDNINSTPVLKTYQYNTAQPNFMVNGFTGLINYGFFVHVLTARNWTSHTAGPPGINATKRVRTYLAESALNLTPTEGNPVAYTTVTEYTGTPAANTGKSVYVFRYQADEWSGSATSTGVPVVLDHFYARGQLSSKTDYLRKSNGTYQVVKCTNNSYTAFPETLYADVGMVIGQRKRSDGDVNIAHYGQVLGQDADEDAYPFNTYSIVSDDNYLTSTSTTTYDLADTTKSSTSSVGYNYGTDIVHQQIISTTHVDSKGNTRTTNNKYAFNYPANNSVIDTMVNRHMWADVIEKAETYTIGATTKTTSAQLNQFKYGYIPNTIVPDKISVLNIPAPVADFTASSVSAGSLTKDSRYVQMISFDTYGPQNNIAQYTPRNSTPVSLLWDYNYEQPVAQIKNATNNTVFSQVAYTSFEAPRNGGWYYTGIPVTDPTAPTGNMVYPLNLGAVTLSYVDGTKTNILSLWSNNGAPTVTAGTSLTGTALRTNSNWTYYEYQVPAGSSSITISGTTTIDELRLYPADAQMTTYAYDPNGVTDMADTKGTINHFDYDAFARLKNVKDWAGNIVKNYGYHTYDQVKGNAAIGLTTFTRNNCPAGTSPTSTTYSVPANRYYASTTAAANAEATYDLNTNGQIKANTVCGCPIQYISVTLTNNTGHAGYQATFTGIATPYNFPATGSTVVSVPAGTYATLSINPVGSFTATFTLGTRTPVTAHFASFSSVVIGPGSPDLTLSIN
jgi:hypothetical protein